MDNDEAHSFTALGITKVQGAPVFAILTVRNNELMSIIPVSPSRQSTALEEAVKLIQELKEMAD